MANDKKDKSNKNSDDKLNSKKKNIDNDEHVIKYKKIKHKEKEAQKEYQTLEKKNSENNKYRFNSIEVVIIMVVTSLISLLLGGFIAYARIDGREVNCSVIRRDVSEFSGVYDALINELYTETKLDKEKLLESAIKGMISSVNDPYAAYIDKDAALTLDEELKGSFIGIGAMVKSDGTLPVIESVYEDGPCEKAGLKAGDIISKVEDTSLEGLTANEVSSLIKTRDKGAKIKLTIVRDNETKEYEITREAVELKSVSITYADTKNGKVGVIAITNFAENTYDQFRKAYNEAKDNNVVGLIIDVRNNVGGYLSSAYNIASMFLDKDTVVYKKDTKGKIEEFKTDTRKIISLKTVVLTNYGTASAAEVLASALKENLNIDVVGTKTYGKGTIQKLHQLNNGGYVRYTSQYWLNPKGINLNGVGIEPTVLVEESNDTTKDVQLEAAIELFNK